MRVLASFCVLFLAGCNWLFFVILPFLFRLLPIGAGICVLVGIEEHNGLYLSFGVMIASINGVYLIHKAVTNIFIRAWFYFLAIGNVLDAWTMIKIFKFYTAKVVLLTSVQYEDAFNRVQLYCIFASIFAFVLSGSLLKTPK